MSNAARHIQWHSLEPEIVLERLHATRNGLDAQEARERLAQYGENVLPARKPPTLLGIFLRQFKSPLIYILLAATVVALLLQEFTDAIFILVVLLLHSSNLTQPKQ